MKPEARVQSQILGYLRLNRIFHWRQNSGSAVMRNERGGKRFIKFGVNGVPDIICCVNVDSIGVFVGIECKSKIGKQSPHQKLFQENLEEAGGIYILARDVEDVIEALKRLRTTQVPLY